eukprot:349914-Pyramimonas_sp.AAC.1
MPDQLRPWAAGEARGLRCQRASRLGWNGAGAGLRQCQCSELCGPRFSRPPSFCPSPSGPACQRRRSR